MEVMLSITWRVSVAVFWNTNISPAEGEAKQRLWPMFYHGRPTNLERLSHLPRVITMMNDEFGKRMWLISWQQRSWTPLTLNFMSWMPKARCPVTAFLKSTCLRFLLKEAAEPWGDQLYNPRFGFYLSVPNPKYSSFFQTKYLGKSRGSPNFWPSSSSVFTLSDVSHWLSPGTIDHLE